MELEVVTIGQNGISTDDILVHDETNRILATMLVAMDPPAFPVAIGVIYCDPADSYVDAVRAKTAPLGNTVGKSDINALLRKGHTWNIE